MIRLSRNLAIFLGIITPLMETLRRWSTWQERPQAFFDDYILGALLLYGAWRVGQDGKKGQKFLSAAWGFALALVYVSFFGQMESNRHGIIDPAPISGEWVLIIKGIGFILVIVGFITSLSNVSDNE